MLNLQRLKSKETLLESKELVVLRLQLLELKFDQTDTRPHTTNLLGLVSVRLAGHIVIVILVVIAEILNSEGSRTERQACLGCFLLDMLRKRCL